jgi:hypothetical protein
LLGCEAGAQRRGDDGVDELALLFGGPGAAAALGEEEGGLGGGVDEVEDAEHLPPVTVGGVVEEHRVGLGGVDAADDGPLGDRDRAEVDCLRRDQLRNHRGLR